jgi:hypothetical protein
VTVPEIVPVRNALAGRSNEAAGLPSAPAPAFTPMPRCAKTFQMVSWSAPPYAAVSATRIALRMSRKVGVYGASSIARVTRASDLQEPSASRRSHRVCAQISPSAWTSGPPRHTVP